MSRAVECVILIGLPGAGKTTFYRQRFDQTHGHISKDLLPNRTGRGTRQQELIEENLSAQKSVVIDNTNPTAAERARLIAVARGNGARVIGYFFDVTTRVAVARNSDRTGPSKVPNVAIFTAAKRLQRPTLTEGFDELYRVELNEDRSFRVISL